MIVMSSRMKQKPTHFISIPMNNAEIMRNFTQFQVQQYPKLTRKENINTIITNFDDIYSNLYKFNYNWY